MNILETTLKEIGDGRQYLFCSKHFYTPSKVSRPTEGCAECWKALYVTIWAKQKPEDRQEFVEGLESAIRHFAEGLKDGTWDLKLHKPIVDIEHVDDDLYVPDSGPKIQIEE